MHKNKFEYMISLRF